MIVMNRFQEEGAVQGALSKRILSVSILKGRGLEQGAVQEGGPVQKAVKDSLSIRIPSRYGFPFGNRDRMQEYYKPIAADQRRSSWRGRCRSRGSAQKDSEGINRR